MTNEEWEMANITVWNLVNLLEKSNKPNTDRLDQEIREFFNGLIHVLGLSKRAMHCLLSERIYEIDDLVKKTPKELLGIINFGKTTLREVEAALADRGLKLAEETPR